LRLKEYVDVQDISCVYAWEMKSSEKEERGEGYKSIKKNKKKR